MTNLAKLNVSLTKHGAHKIAALLKKFDKDVIMSKVQGKELGINIDAGQARKNLSVAPDGTVPEEWNTVRQFGGNHINALVFVAIIFSHKNLIDAMRAGGTGHYVGTVNRDGLLKDKAFTNFACIVEELGFSTFHSKSKVSYDLSSLFNLQGLGPLAKKVLVRKLKLAGWSGNNTVEEECIALNLHEVFGVPPQEFSGWLSACSEEGGLEDLDFFSGEDGPVSGEGFKFVAGHSSKKTGSVAVNAGAPKSANLVHNEIQNKLYERMCVQYGEANVGTEVPTGEGTSIDIVVKHPGSCTFYEIKTAGTLKACIRQAIPQLLEYAYWGCSADRADRLVIVSPHALTADAEAYLTFLRESFNVPLEYEQFVF
ncbi:hypothetical protein [Vogesella sp. AC12]|uniref:hypothetical protein n=1 Tax=Vogesella sp. AC12 TaxID=2950550 RepID=UPI00210A4086|nr:hypothetical protein [Vogesella sp. AC12]MCQ4145805.1 hypothetical protein [Vogesella sp. AC12]